MDSKIIEVRCIDNGNCGDISLGIDYNAIETEKGYKIISFYTYPKKYFKKIQSDAEERIEYTQDKENRCYNKECPHNYANICGAFEKGLVCVSRTKEPLNYEEEYRKIKAENEELEKGRDTLNQRLNVAYSENTDLNNQIGELDEILLNVETERDKILNDNKEFEKTIQSKNKGIELLENQIENELGRNRIINEKLERYQMHNNKGYMEQINIALNEKNEEIKKLTQKNEMNEAYLKTYESIIKNQKEAIKAMAKLI